MTVRDVVIMPSILAVCIMLLLCLPRCAVGKQLGVVDADELARPEDVEHMQQVAQARAEAQQGGSKDPMSFRIVSVACGPRHTLALTSSGRVFAWGCNANGQLGLGDKENRYVPTLVKGELGAARCIMIAATWRGSSALTRERVVYEWGAAGAVAESMLRASRGQGLDPHNPTSYLAIVEDTLPRRAYVKVCYVLCILPVSTSKVSVYASPIHRVPRAIKPRACIAHGREACPFHAVSLKPRNRLELVWMQSCAALQMRLS